MGGPGGEDQHYDASGVRINYTSAQVDVFLNKVLDDACRSLPHSPRT